MNDIFISYKVHNRKTAIEYYKSYKALGYNVWFDQLVPKNEDWKKTIKKQISLSKVFLCLLSKACLLDDWVLYQVQLAKKYHKEIIYVTLDDTEWKKHPEYNVPQEVYHTFADIPIKTYFDAPKLAEPKMEDFGHPLLTLGIFGIVSFLVLCLGLRIYNLYVDADYGILITGVLAMLFMSYLLRKYIYIINTILGLSFLAISIFIFPAFFTSGIPINSILLIFFLTLGLSLRYSKRKWWLALILALLCALFLTAVDAAIVTLFAYFLDFDCSWVSLILFLGYIVFNYWGIKEDYKMPYFGL